jgi:hypothetical protein
MAATMHIYVVIPDNDRPKSVSRITVRTEVRLPTPERRPVRLRQG